MPAHRRPHALIRARIRRGVAAGLAALLGVTVVAVVTAYAADADPAFVTLLKAASPAPPDALGPGDTVVFNFTVNCSSDVSDCVGLQITDELPAPLVLRNVSISGGGAPVGAEGSFATTENSFVLTFTNALDGGKVGLPDGYSVDFVATALVPLDVAADFNGRAVTNRAEATLDYTPSNTYAEADILLQVPTTLASEVGKSVEPTSAPAVPGTRVDYRLTGENSSNTGVDELVIQDPAVIDIDRPFHYLEPSGVVIETWPDGADQVRVDWHDGDDWVPGAASAAPNLPEPEPGTEIHGLRWVFSNSEGDPLARGAEAVVALETSMRANVAEIDPAHSVVSSASSWVRLGGDTSPPVRPRRRSRSSEPRWRRSPRRRSAPTASSVAARSQSRCGRRTAVTSLSLV